MFRLTMNSGGGHFKNQLKRADKSGADHALILGDDECTQSEISIKHLRLDIAQRRIPQSDLADFLSKYL